MSYNQQLSLKAENEPSESIDLQQKLTASSEQHVEPVSAIGVLCPKCFHLPPPASAPAISLFL